MLGKFTKFASAALQSVLTHGDHIQSERVQTPSNGARLDASVLENRVLFSATPFSPLVDMVSEPLVDANDLPDQWLLEEDYSDSEADSHDPQSGICEVIEDRYHATADGNAISTLSLDQRLPANLKLEVTINADGGTPQHFSNAFIVYDYHGPTDFKYAGALVGIDQWVIGRKTAGSPTSSSVRGLTRLPTITSASQSQATRRSRCMWKEALSSPMRIPTR